MTDKVLSRREFFQRAVALGVMAGVTVACDTPKRQTVSAQSPPVPGGEKAKPAAPVCNDQVGLDEAAKRTRLTFKYVSKTADPAKSCDNCQLYKVGSPCGGCTIVKGSIAPKGYCTAWAAKVG